MKRFLPALLPLALLLMPVVTSASAPHTFQDLSNMVVQLLDNATATLVVLGIVIYFYGVSSNILKFGKGESGGEARRSYFVWGIVVLFVMVSVWGIIQLLQNTLFGGDQFDPTNGTNGGGSLCDSFGNCTLQ